MSTQLLQQRYGAPTPRRRRVVIATIAVIALLGAVWLAWAALAQARGGAVSGQQQDARILDARHAEVDALVRRPEGTDVVCTAQAVDRSNAIVGIASAHAPATGTGEQRVTIAVGTVSQAAAASLVRCVRRRRAERPRSRVVSLPYASSRWRRSARSSCTALLGPALLPRP